MKEINLNIKKRAKRIIFFILNFYINVSNYPMSRFRKKKYIYTYALSIYIKLQKDAEKEADKVRG